MDSDLEYIYEHYVESSYEEEYSDETVMMQAVLEDVERAEEHVLKFKGSYYDDYFVLKKDIVGMIGFSGYQKCTAALWILAYGMAANSWDEYLRMSESTCRDVMVKFATVVVEVFGRRYLSEPTVTDTKRLLEISEARGWPGLLGSLHCMH
ncbi:uncharacterized protein [Aegilops tauschii subsp. strangulata]|uniref:uncharacterized protein n=1 Tax=Aegilops tauschii subsp. strangulata TaxID=200361 RepID=UPI003CC86F13